jgi:hypothetical protein
MNWRSTHFMFFSFMNSRSFCGVGVADIIISPVFMVPTYPYLIPLNISHVSFYIPNLGDDPNEGCIVDRLEATVYRLK